MSKNKHLNISIKTSLFKKMKPTTLSSQPIPSQPFRPASTPTRVDEEMHELATSFINQRTPDVPASKQIKASIKFLSSSLKRICALWKRLFPKTPASPTAQQQPVLPSVYPPEPPTAQQQPSSLETLSEPPTAQQQPSSLETLSEPPTAQQQPIPPSVYPPELPTAQQQPSSPETSSEPPAAQQQPASHETPAEPPTAQQQTIESALKYSETDENLRSHKQIFAQVFLMFNVLNVPQQKTSLFEIFSLAATYNIPIKSIQTLLEKLLDEKTNPLGFKFVKKILHEENTDKLFEEHSKPPKNDFEKPFHDYFKILYEKIFLPLKESHPLSG